MGAVDAWRELLERALLPMLPLEQRNLLRDQDALHQIYLARQERGLRIVIDDQSTFALNYYRCRNESDWTASGHPPPKWSRCTSGGAFRPEQRVAVGAGGGLRFVSEAAGEQRPLLLHMSGGEGQPLAERTALLATLARPWAAEVTASSRVLLLDSAAHGLCSMQPQSIVRNGTGT